MKDLDRLRVLFLADISHELRIPLTVLQGEAEVTLRGKAESLDTYWETLERMLTSQAQILPRLSWRPLWSHLSTATEQLPWRAAWWRA